MKVLVGTKQFKMVVDEDLVNRLKSAANKAGRDSAQHLAEEILTIYLPVYNAVLEATRRAMEYQSANYLPKIYPSVEELEAEREIQNLQMIRPDGSPVYTPAQKEEKTAEIKARLLSHPSSKELLRKDLGFSNVEETDEYTIAHKQPGILSPEAEEEPRRKSGTRR